MTDPATVAGPPLPLTPLAAALPQPVAGVTALLRDLESSEARPQEATERLLPLVYEQLRAIAQQRMAGERLGGAGHTLQATALVHEAFLKLMGREGTTLRWNDTAHFLRAAAEAMRRILVDHARSRARLKRGGDLRRAEPPYGLDAIGDVLDLARDVDPETVLALDEAIRRLEEGDPESAEVVRLRFYAGLSVEQTAEVLGISSRTVKRDWQFARAWLYRQLEHLRTGTAGGPERADGQNGDRTGEGHPR